MDSRRLRKRIITTIDEVQGLLARLIVKRHMHKSTKIMEAEARGRALGMKLGAMIERETRDHSDRQTRETISA